METGEKFKRVTRQGAKNLPAVHPTEKKRESTGSPRAKKVRRPRRSKLINETAETPVETTNVDLKQGSWSSGWSPSDDEELPPAVLCSPAKASQNPTFKKHDIVWITYRRDVYRPCLITSITKDIVKFKYIYGKRSDTYRTRLHNVIGFDDPDKNNKLLEIGRKVSPHIVDAYERARLYFCRISEQKDLSPLKYLFFDKTEDLLYGIVPEHEVEKKDSNGKEKEDDETEDYEFDGPVSSEDENVEIDDNPKQNNDEPYDDVHKRMTVEEKEKLFKNLKILLEAISSKDCFTYLKQIVEESIESSRMKLLKEQKELDLQMKSGGLGPFYGAEVSETDKLFQIIDDYAEKMQFKGDSSLLARHVLIPEAIIFSLQKQFKWSQSIAEEFFMEWMIKVPTWPPEEI